MHRNRLSILLLAVFLCLASNLLATDWYVDNTASGSNNGTSWTNAWQSFSAISWGSVSPGDTIFISGGSTSKTYLERLEVQKAGTTNSHITIRPGQDAGHNGVVIIDGEGVRTSILDSHNYTTVNGEYQGARHIKVRNSTMLRESTLVDYTSSTDSKLLWCELETCGIAVAAQNGSGGEYSHNYIHDVRGDAAIRLNSRNQGQSGLYDLTLVYDNQIQLNVTTGGEGPDGIQGCVGLSVVSNSFSSVVAAIAPDGANHCDFVQCQTRYIAIYNNHFLNISDSAIDQDLWGATDGSLGWLRIYNNLFTMTRRAGIPSGIRIYKTGGGNVTSIEEVYILNNTFVDQAYADTGGYPVAFGYGSSGNPTITNVQIQNNIFYNSGHASPSRVLINCLDSSNATQNDWSIDYNAVNAGALGSTSMNVDGAAYTQSNTFTQVPSFVSYVQASPSNNLHLTGVDMAARNKGRNLTALCALMPKLCFDRDGVARGGDGAWDIGAYEFVGTSQPSSPPAPPSNLSISDGP